MADRRLPGTDVRVRRGRREDLGVVQALLGPAAAASGPRLMRRLVQGLANDLYLAEDAAGTAVGLVAVGYVRSLASGGLLALLDVLVAPAEPAAIRDGLIGVAEGRARRRGCRELAAWPAAGDPAVHAALVARGYRSREGMVRRLQEDG